MSKFTTFQCTVCGKSKDFLKDSLRVLPNNCSITVNCLGKLYPQGDKAFSENYYAQDIEYKEAPVASEQQPKLFSLSNAKNPLINIAVMSPSALPNRLDLNLSLQKVDNIAYKQYSFKLSQGSSSVPELVNGSPKKDTSGKILSFTNDDIANGKVAVTINGIPAFVGGKILSLAPGVITFSEVLPSGTQVTVLVYEEQKVREEKLTFYKHEYRKLVYGSWSNISSIKSYEIVSGNNPTAWTLYACDNFQPALGNYLARINSLRDEGGSVIKSPQQLDEVLFLLSRYPHDTIDRYTNFVTLASSFSTSFILNFSYITTPEIFAPIEQLKEIYPPLIIEPAAIIGNLTQFIDRGPQSDSISTMNIFNSKKIKA